MLTLLTYCGCGSQVYAHNCHKAHKCGYPDQCIVTITTTAIATIVAFGLR